MNRSYSKNSSLLGDMPSKYATTSNVRCDENIMTSHVRHSEQGLSSLIALVRTAVMRLNKGPFKCYVTLFSRKLDPHPPPRNANNVEYYTFVTLFFGKLDTPPHPHLRYITLEWPPRAGSTLYKDVGIITKSGKSVSFPRSAAVNQG